MKNLLLVMTGMLASFVNIESLGQGCIPIRSSSGCSINTGAGAILPRDAFVVGLNYRYFHSYKHFRGRIEEKERVEMGTQVINDSYFADFSLTYAFADRYYAILTLPLVYHERSSMYEHGGNGLRDRHSTYAGGLGDMRVAVGYWLFTPEKHPKWNVALALGLKLPTGDYNATDKFYNVGLNGQPEIRPVDQSIQPGDGGLGATLEVQGYHLLSERLALNGNLYYLVNPREHNGTRRRPGAEPYASPDQYAARIGLTCPLFASNLEGYLGGRLEGVPVYDLIGGSNAYRRPGYVISVEPGASYRIKNLLLNISIPVAVERNRTQSYLDKLRERETGEPTHGDAAFADYLINVSIAYTFHKMDPKAEMFKVD